MSDEIPGPEQWPRRERPAGEVPAGEGPAGEVPAADLPDDEAPANPASPPPPYETAAPGLDPPPGPVLDGGREARRRGLRALAAVVAGLVLVELLLYAGATSFAHDRYGETFITLQQVVFLVGLVTFIVVGVRLPAASRTAYLAGCAITCGGLVILAGVFCGVVAFLSMR